MKKFFLILSLAILGILDYFGMFTNLVFWSSWNFFDGVLMNIVWLSFVIIIYAIVDKKFKGIK